ncbi:MAG: hypothetical protein GXY83_10770 [Rhodopirellula sp.]|nr:hypothetical protein [Rhodopirellula sp.]
MTTARTSRSNRLLQILDGYRQILVVTHDNPDPDAIASGWAVTWMVEQKLRKPARLIGGGDIVRAENKHMLHLLRPPIELVRSITCPPAAAVVLVDCGPGSQNHLFASDCVPPVAVIDHHSLNASRHAPRLAFRDIRPRIAASATIAACYLREQKLNPSTQLATALVYAIRTETRGCQTYHSRTDRSALLWLTERADFTRLADIENAPLSIDYFSDMALALQNTTLYDDAAFCLLPRASGAEIVGEVADLLIRCNTVRRVLCGAVVEGHLVISVRTDYEAENATDLVRSTLLGIGEGGGHSHRAGGKIPSIAGNPAIPADIEGELRRRWLAACRLPLEGGRFLIARQEIVRNL